MRSSRFIPRVVTSLALGFELSCMFGCGGFSNGGTTAKNTYAYVLEENRTTEGMSIAQFQVASDGTFTALNPASVASQAYSSYPIVNPSGQYFFVNGSQNPLLPGTILPFAIGTDGTLSANAGDSITTGSGAGMIAFTPNGQFAVVPNVGDNTLSSYAVGSTGSLHLVNTVLAGFGPGSVAIDSSGRFAYVTASGGDGEFTLTEYVIASDGILTPAVTYPLWSSPGALVVSPQGFLYLNEYMLPYNSSPGSIIQFSVNESNGNLNVAKIYATADSDPSGVIFNPAGTYAYVGNGSGTISQFTVDQSSGILTANGTLPSGYAETMDPSGNYIYTAVWGLNNTWAPQVVRYAINSDGTLSADGTSTMLDTNASPLSLVIAQH